ncbi:hypothetical protein CSB93_3067 [Pseudomonas paraeruginosa]|uniref:Uncharacterized protein n=1 Tax=Pseudomonas paraeruginosa TaxID=2994495 RepID=A0A2R3IM58_9PSED|nr:hypothetical protein CSB93_3067 [Pseudomonas paraeruginosa]AWE95319.1 hypothetical protein CSC28_1842 [Pseudomonas paraeruginosa]
MVVRGRRQVDGDDAAGVEIEPGHGFDKNTVSLAEKIEARASRDRWR